MKQSVISALFLLGSTTLAYSQEECRAVENDLDRLACYDKASGRAPTTSRPVKSNAWSIQEQTSKLTDDRSISLTSWSNEEINCGWNNGAKIALVVRCHEKTTSLFFATGCHMVSSDYNDYGKIEYRVDNQKARSVTGDVSTDNKALGLWSGGKAIPVVKQLFDGNTLVVRMTPYSESPFTATFDVSGLEDAAKPLREECEW